MAGIRVTSGALTASTVAQVTFPSYYRWALVANRGTNEIFVRLDGVNPSVDGDDCDVVLPGTEKLLSNPKGYPENNVNAATVSSNTDVRLISSGTPKYTVTGAN